MSMGTQPEPPRPLCISLKYADFFECPHVLHVTLLGRIETLTTDDALDFGRALMTVMAPDTSKTGVRLLS